MKADTDQVGGVDGAQRGDKNTNKPVSVTKICLHCTR